MNDERIGLDKFYLVDHLTQYSSSATFKCSKRLYYTVSRQFLAIAAGLGFGHPPHQTFLTVIAQLRRSHLRSVNAVSDRLGRWTAQLVRGERSLYDARSLHHCGGTFYESKELRFRRANLFESPNLLLGVYRFYVSSFFISRNCFLGWADGRLLFVCCYCVTVFTTRPSLRISRLLLGM